ncbi:unnamed protein product, partial [Oppiella nova]
EATLLIRAADLGDRLIHCFDTPQHLVPFSDVNLQTRSAKTPNWSPDSSLSEATTFSKGTITLGARGDSYYEYLLKQYLQT